VSGDGVQRRGDRPKPGEPGYVDEREATGRRGYRWPSFTAKNEMSLKHGAMSARKVDPVADELIEGLLARRGDLVAFPEAVHAWARAEARCLLLADWFATHGLLDENGKATASEALLGQSERLAAQLRDSLGLTPKSEAELAQSQASAAQSVVDLDALRARGREALKARRALDAGRVRGERGRDREGGEAS
jgi:hypothetical protein